MESCRTSWFLRVAGLLGLALAGCAQEEYPLTLWLAQHPDASMSQNVTPEASTPVDRGPEQCKQTLATSYPARLAAIGAGADAGATDGASAEAAPVGMTYLEADLYQQYFVPICGRCHGSVGGGLGGFQIQTQTDFHNLFTSDVLAHATSNGPSGQIAADGIDPLDPMPPFPPGGTGEPFKMRDPGEPIWQFATLAQAWLTAGKPMAFVASLDTGSAVDAGTSAAAAAAIPIPNAAIGNAMTNIGNCIPTPGLVGIEQTTSAALDKMFAGARAAPTGSGATAVQIIGLPEHLRDTDLFTFDSAVLAQYGVLAFAPAYPLWSDNAAKLRHIRVPRGTSVVFDKATQTWTIPPNTRFYKTFMKPIVDVDGSERYRKIETRLIVARPDTISADGTKTPTALFGTYKWNDDESDAVLVQTPLNSGEPFADTVLQYTTDEPLAADILQGAPALPDEQLLENGAARHYAIPSSQRCMQCHMGSATGTFSLGFLPLQIHRRPVGEGGIIEATGPDELTQLQRFIDYGLITGMDSPEDVLPLEQSEGTRTPRNGFELLAQGYMLGNCSHCHNPNGYPSTIAPVLINVLNFLPTPTSGVFQFPLDRTSPRIFRGPIGQTPIPYLTPSLMDLPRTDLDGFPILDPFIQAGVAGDGTPFIRKGMFAPWRSLIFRNVDNPFAYTDDLALYPHMPMNTPGYDPRAKQIMSQWMVSIPAVRKSPEIPEYAFYTASLATGDISSVTFGQAPEVDKSSQPYVEVLPGDTRYDSALAAANERLKLLWNGISPPGSAADAGTDASGTASDASSANAATPSQQTLVPTGPNTVAYSHFQDLGDTRDILDPAVLSDPVCHSIPTPPPSGAGATLPYPITAPVPDHCHWVITDSTQPPGDWSPRRPDWATVLVDNATADGGADKSSATQCGETADSVAGAAQDEQAAITLLQNIPPLASVNTFLTTPIPFGLWQVKAGCDFSKVRTADSYKGAERPLWMDIVGATNEPVYSQTPGEAVFKMVCINCHGAKADSNGRLAQNLATMTGGLAQVADFRDGLFGPVGTSDGDINRVFGAAGLPAGTWTAPAITNDDRAARYMAWMALGGTKVRIPDGILAIVSLTQVLDQHREASAAGQHISANMLSTVKGLCTSLLGCSYPREVCSPFNQDNPTSYSASLIHKNGDAELWLKLCSLNNPPPIHVIDHGTPGVDAPFNPSSGAFVFTPDTLYEPASYMGPIGGDRTTWPWCEYISNSPVAGTPYCKGGTDFTADDAEKWAVRGAINAGLAVFLYVQSLEKMNPPPDYNQCEQLP